MGFTLYQNLVQVLSPEPSPAAQGAVMWNYNMKKLADEMVALQGSFDHISPTFNASGTAPLNLTYTPGSADAFGLLSGSIDAASGTGPGTMSASHFLLLSGATNANTANTLVKRDASGNFSAGTITATLSGNATSITGSIAQSQVTNLVTDLAAKATTAALTAHTSDTNNPHSVTKSQVGLGSVVNSLQLVAANNLSDLTNAVTARTNLGLGSAATSATTDFASASAFTAHTGNAAIHRSINDAGTSATDLWSASKIGTVLAGKVDTGTLSSYYTSSQTDTLLAAKPGIDDDVPSTTTTYSGTRINNLLAGVTTYVDANYIPLVASPVNGHVATVSGTGTLADGGVPLSDLAMASDVSALSGTLSGHIADTNNPHQVTADQVLPDQTASAGLYLTTNGTTVSWATVSGGGGAAISDGTTGTTTTWSSSKISSEIAAAAPDLSGYLLLDGSSAMTGDLTLDAAGGTIHNCVKVENVVNGIVQIRGASDTIGLDVSGSFDLRNISLYARGNHIYMGGGNVEEVGRLEVSVDATHHVVTGTSTPVTNDFYLSLGWSADVATIYGVQQGVGGVPVSISPWLLVNTTTHDGSSALQVEGDAAVSGTVTAAFFVGDGSGLTNLPSGGSTDLNGLTDVTITSAATGNLLRYNGSQWVNTTLSSGDIPNIAESQVTGLTTDLAAKSPLASPTFTGTVTLPAVSIGDASNVALGTTTGTKIGTATTQKLGFFNSTPIVKPTGNIITALSNLGLVGSGTIAESDVTNLTTDLAAKAPLASPTFTGTVTTAAISIGDGSNVTLGTTTGTKFGTGSTQKIGFFGAAPVAQQTGNLVTALSNLGLVTSGTIAESDVTNLTTDLAAKAPLASPTFTGTVTLPAVSVGDGSNIALGTTAGTKIGTASTQKLGFFGATAVVQQTGNLITALSTLGLVTSGTIAESDVTNLTTDLAAKAPLASPTFTGTVTTAAVSIGDGSSISVGSTTGTKIGTATTQKLGFFNATPVVQQTGNIKTALANLGLVTGGTIAESDVTNLTTDLAAKANLASPTFTGTVTLPAVSVGDGSNVALGTTTGTKIGTATNQKLGFFNSAPVVQQTGNLITALSNLGLIVSGTIAESDVTNLTTDLAAKAPLASPTFTGTVTLPSVSVGDGSNIALGTTTGTQIGTAGTQKIGFYGVTPVVRQLATTDIKDALTSYGLLQGTSASPLDLDGGSLSAGAITATSITNNISTQKVIVSKGGTTVGTRKQINLVEGSNVTLTVSDDSVNDRVNVTITSTGVGGSASPAGSDTYVQFNDGGVFGGDAGLTFNKATGTLSATVFSGSGASLTSIPESAVTNLTTDLAAKAPLASPTFTGTVTLPAVSIGDGSNIVLGTTTGTKFGTGSTQKIGFFGATPVAQQTGNLITALSSLGLVTSGTIAESDVTNLTTDLAGKAPLASPTFTGTVTTAAVSIGDGSNIALGTTTGTKIGTSALQKLGFFNATPVVQQTGNLITALSSLGLVTSGTIAEGDVTNLTTDLAAKASLASPTFTGTVTLPDVTMGDAKNITLNATTGTKLGTATTQKLGFFNATPVAQQTGNLITALSNLGLVVTGTIAESDVTNLTTDLAAKAPLASPTFTGTVTTAAISIGDGSNVTLGTTTGTKFGTGPTQKLGFYGATAVVQPTGNIVTALSNLGLVSGGTIAESDVANLTTDLAAKANLASPTFTGTVTTAAVAIGDGSDISLGTTTGTKIGTATTQKLGFFNSTPIVKPTGNIITALSNLGLVGSGTIAESDVTNLTTDLAAKAPLASPTFTGTVTLPAVSVGDGSNIALGATTGTKIGTATTQKLGFFNSTPVAQQTGSIVTALSNLGLVTSGTIAESDVTNLTTDLAAKAPLASPTFTGTVTTAAVSIGDGSNIALGTTTGTKIGTATTQKLGFYNSTPIVKPTGNLVTALGNLGLVGSGTVASADISDAASASTASVVVKRDANGGANFKRVLLDEVSVAYSASITPNADTTEALTIAALTGNLTINNPTGTPQNRQRLVIRWVQDGTGGRTISWGTKFLFTATNAQTAITTTANKYVYVAWEWNSGLASGAGQWVCMAIHADVG